MTQIEENTANIHPIFDRLISRGKKEEKLGQRSLAIWLTGLSGSGKSTIALGFEQRLFKQNYLVKLLDGDNIRSGLCNNLSFTDVDRRENIRRIAEVSKLFIDCGIITINTFVSPTKFIRMLAQNVIGEKDFIEVYVKSSLETCENRDVKGLYKKVRKGEIPYFTGITSPYEVPDNPNLIIDTELLSLENSVDKLFTHIINKIKI